MRRQIVSCQNTFTARAISLRMMPSIACGGTFLMYSFACPPDREYAPGTCHEDQSEVREVTHFPLDLRLLAQRNIDSGRL